MRTVEFLDVPVEGAGALGKIKFDPFLAAVASLRTIDGKQMVSTWIDPSPTLNITEGDVMKVRDASGFGILNTHFLSSPLGTSDIGGQPAFSASEPSTLLQGTAPDVRAEEFSMLVVHDIPKPSNDRYALFGIGAGSVGEDVLFPGLEIGSDGADMAYMTIREGGTTTRRIVAQDEGIFGGPAISMVTFSVQKGVSLWLNSTVLKEDPNDARPLTTPTWAFLGNRSSNESARGVFGMSMILRGDLSRPEYSYARELIIGGLMKKYSINS